MATAEVRLTQLSHGAGCACKLPAAATARGAARRCRAVEAADLIVGSTPADDAAVVADRATSWRVVQTIDFFTPIVDDPYDFGRIAATNALSDIYAMGGRPLLALNLVAWPPRRCRSSCSARSCAAAPTSPRAAGALVAGGHSIDDPEPKYGMAVDRHRPPGRGADEHRRRGRATCSCSRSRSGRVIVTTAREARHAGSGGGGRRGRLDDDPERRRRPSSCAGRRRTR